MSVTLEFRPKLRWPLDIQPIDVDGEESFLLRDQLGVADETLVVPSAVLQLILSFDGTLSVREWSEELQESGAEVDHLLTFVNGLERIGFLESETSARRWEAIKQEFEQTPVRPPAFAGVNYPEDPAELRTYIESFLSRVPPAEVEAGRDLWGIMCPHIDYQRGGDTYAATYRLLENYPTPDLIVLMGTAHQPSKSPFIFSKKGFKTPLGTFEVDNEALGLATAAIASDIAFGDEILHRKEHSLELQLPFLAHLFQSRGDALPKILPLLIGSFHPSVTASVPPDAEPTFRSTIEGLSRVKDDYEERGKRVWFFNGIDLAHVGKFFGDFEQVAPSKLSVIEERDRELLDAIVAVNRSDLFKHIAEDGDARKICGFPTLYTFLALAEHRGEKWQSDIVEYRQAVDTDTDCVVTFASAYWTSLKIS